jgi:hypothetical protein
MAPNQFHLKANCLALAAVILTCGHNSQKTPYSVTAACNCEFNPAVTKSDLKYERSLPM